MSMAAADHKEIMISLITKLIQPNLTFNRSATERRKQVALERVKPVFFKVQKDEFLVRAGQQVTPADVDKLESYYSDKAGGDLIRSTTLLGTILIVALFSLILLTRRKAWTRISGRQIRTYCFSVL